MSPRRTAVHAAAWMALWGGGLLLVSPARADEPAQVPVAEGAASAAVHRHHARRGAPPPRSVSEVVEERLRLLSAELGLDERQQAGVRQALVDERLQTQRVWSDTTVPAPLRIKATQEVAERTASRIRALLDDAQRQRYSQPRPATPPAPGADGELARYLGASDGR